MEQGELELWKWTYDHLIRIEQHWTSQLQNQQQRIATVFATDGLLLGFLGSVAFGTRSSEIPTWASSCLLASLVLLTVALVPGLLALWSKVDVLDSTGRKEDPASRWLQAKWLMTTVQAHPDLMTVLRSVSDSLEDNQARAEHSDKLAKRRTLLRAQTGLTFVALLLLILAVAGTLF